MWRFVSGAKPPEKRAKMSNSGANYEQEKRKRKPQSAWKVNRPWFLFKEFIQYLLFSYYLKKKAWFALIVLMPTYLKIKPSL